MLSFRNDGMSHIIFQKLDGSGVQGVAIFSVTKQHTSTATLVSKYVLEGV